MCGGPLSASGCGAPGRNIESAQRRSSRHEASGIFIAALLSSSCLLPSAGHLRGTGEQHRDAWRPYGRRGARSPWSWPVAATRRDSWRLQRGAMAQRRRCSVRSHGSVRSRFGRLLDRAVATRQTLVVAAPELSSRLGRRPSADGWLIDFLMLSEVKSGAGWTGRAKSLYRATVWRRGGAMVVVACSDVELTCAIADNRACSAGPGADSVLSTRCAPRGLDEA
jgi:hypothetical protein